MSPKIIRVKVTEEQFELICNKASYYGFNSISAFIRDFALNDMYYLKLLKEIHEKVCRR